MAGLPDVTQLFALDAAAYLSGIDSMLAANDRLAASIDGIITQTRTMAAGAAGAGADAAAASADAAAAADGRLAAAASAEEEAVNAAAVADQAAADAADTLGKAISELSIEIDATIAAIDDEIAAVDRQVVAMNAAADAQKKQDEAAAGAAGSGKLLKNTIIGVGAGLIYGVVQASKFNEQVTRLQTAAGLTNSDMSKFGYNLGTLGTKLLQIGDQTGYTGTDIANAMYHPISAGLNLAQALNTVTNAAKLAQIHGASLDDTTYSLSSVMKAYNISAGQVTNTSALLNSIVGQGDMRFQDFNQSIKNWTPTGASMGISIQSMGAALAYLTDRGNTAEVASTRLTMGLSMVTAGSKEANTFLSSLGLTSGSVALKNTTLAQVMNGYGLTTNKIASDLKKPDGIYYALTDLQGAFKHAGLNAAQADQVMAKIFGGGRSDKAMLSLMSNLDGVKQKYQQIGQGVKDYGASWQKAQATTAVQWKTTVADAKNLATAFGTALLPAVNKVLGGFNKFLQSLLKSKGETQAVAAILGTVLAGALANKLEHGLVSAYKGFENLGKGAVATVKFFKAGEDGVSGFSKVLGGIGKVGSGIGNVITGIGSGAAKLGSLAVTGVGKLYSAVDKAAAAAGRAAIQYGSLALQYAKAGAAAAASAIKTVAVKVAQLAAAAAARIWTAAQWLLDAAMDANPIALIVIAIIALIAIFVLLWVKCAAFRDFWIGVWHFISDAVRDAVNWIKAHWMLLVAIILGPIALVLYLVIKYWHDITKAIGDALSAIEKAVVAAWNAVYSAVKTAVMDVYHAVLTAFDDTGKAVDSAVSAVLHAVESAWNSVYNAVKTAVLDVYHAVLNAFNDVVNAVSHALSVALNTVISVGQNILSFFTGLPGKILGALGNLGSLLLSAGASLIDGLINGVEGAVGGLMSTIGHIASDVAGAFKSVLGIFSPSTVFQQIGVNIVQGTVLGLQQKAATLVNTMHDIALKLRDGMIAGLTGTAANVKSAVSKMITDVQEAYNAGDITWHTASSLADYLEWDNGRLQSLANQRASIQKTIAAADKYAASVSASAVSFVGISNLTSDQSTTAAGIAGGLQQNLQQLQQFASDLQKLGRLGLNKTILDQIIQAGPVQGDQLAQALITGPKSYISQINKTEAAVTGVANQVGQAAADAMYDTGQNAGKGFLSGLNSTLGQINSAMSKIAWQMVNTMKKELRIRSPSAVMQEIGGYIAEGLARGIEGGQGRVGSAMAGLTGVAGSTGFGAAAGGTQINVTVNVPAGYVGSEQQLAQAFYLVIQRGVLQNARRNGSNGLVLAR